MSASNQRTLKDARIPKDLRLADWVRAILHEISLGEQFTSTGIAQRSRRVERWPETILAQRIKVDRRTVETWRDSTQTESGPTVQLNTYNFQDLYSEGQILGVNMEAFCLGPELWRPNVIASTPGIPFPKPLDPGKRFRVHGGALAGEMLCAPLALTAGPLSARAEQVHWMLCSGFGVVEMKTCLSHHRDPRRTDQMSALAELPVFLPKGNFGNTVLTQPFDRDKGNQYGWAVRLGAPSTAPAIWIAEIDAAIDAASAGQIVIPSIAAHVSEASDEILLLADWRRVAELIHQTKARIISINLGCSALHDYRKDIGLAIRACREVAGVLKGTKLFAKLPYLDELELEDFLVGTGDMLHGVVGINCEKAVGCSLDQDGQRTPVWAEKNSEIGIAGPALFPLAKAFLTSFLKIKSRHRNLGHLSIVSGGGVYHLEQISTLLGMGADAVGLSSALLHDSYFGLKARRYIDNHTDRRKARVSLETSAIHEIWLEAYALEVESQNPGTELFTQRHETAVALLGKLLLESQMRISILENAAKESKKGRSILTLSELREIIRNGFQGL